RPTAIRRRADPHARASRAGLVPTMSKFSEAFERVEAEWALRPPTSSLRTTADVSTTSAEAAELPLSAPALLASPVHRSDRIPASLVSLLHPTSFDPHQYPLLP